MLMEDDFLFLLYTDFSYFSTVFLMLSPVSSWFPSCRSCYLPLSSPGFLPVDYATPLMVARFHMISSQVSSCLIMSFTVFLLVDYVFLLYPPCLIMFPSCPHCFPPGWSCPHGFLRGILIRIATILWFVWFDDCLRLPVKLSFFLCSSPTCPVSLFLICSVYFSFYCYDDLIFSLFRWY